MSQGFYAAVSAIKANQSKLNVISDNIANMGTVAFKGSLVNFETVFSQTLSQGSGPGTVIGGSNPMQIGLGVGISEITRNFNSGPILTTGRSSDMNIRGDGFFTVENPEGGVFLTRAGNFSIDPEGNLVTPKGLKVMGTDTVDGAGTTTTIKIPQKLELTKAVNAAGALVGADVSPSGTVINLGAAPWNTAGWTSETESVELTSFAIQKDGALEATYSNGDKITVTGSPTRELKYVTATGLETTESGVLTVTGSALAANEMQLQMAKVINPKGLLSQGSNLFAAGPNSGTPTFAAAGSGGIGQLDSGSLEGSNIDLTMEFAEMISAQRGIEANGRTFDTQNQIMRTIVNMGR